MRKPGYISGRMARATVETVDHVARLARLSLSEGERQTFARQLDDILAYAESIQALDTAGVEPMSHASGAGAFRDDQVEQGLPRELALESAPDPADGLFRAPRVLAG
jgi:aspartyl-tRNA(Asn)/glutamyl-tRNA(Gln) amidotransferase subunit C